MARSLDEHDEYLTMDGLDLIPIAEGHTTRQLPAPREDLDIAAALAEPATTTAAMEKVESAVTRISTLLPRIKSEDSPITPFPEIGV